MNSGEINLRARSALVIAGVTSWGAGAVATFTEETALPSAVLVVAGALVVLLGLIGRWPDRVAISGNELSWSTVDQVVTSQIEGAKAAGDSGDAVRELEDLRRRLAEVERGRSPSPHPAVGYDRAVEEAIRALRPGDSLTPAGVRSNRTADYTLTTSNGRRLLVETKWQPDDHPGFRARTLPALLSAVPKDARLLVVTNAVDVSAGADQLRAALGDRARIVSWRGTGDNPALDTAIRALTS